VKVAEPKPAKPAAATKPTKKRKLSGSSNDDGHLDGNRRKSARENGQDKASSHSNSDKVTVKEANIPEVEIIETLKVKIKPRTPKRASNVAKDSDTKSSQCATPPPVKKSASDPIKPVTNGTSEGIPEKLQNLASVSVTRADSDTPKTPSAVQRLNSKEQQPKTPTMFQKMMTNSAEVPTTPKTPTLQRVASNGSTGTVGSPQPCSPATMEHRRRSVSVQVAKLKVKAMEDKDKMEKAVKDQDFLLAADLKNSLASTQEEMQKLEKVLERSDFEELKSVISASATPARKRPSDAVTCQTPTTPSVVKTSTATPSSAKVKKLTPKQQKEREEKAKAREEEKKVREEKKLALEKEKEEKKLEREREKKEKEAQKEKEKAEKEAQKEKERVEKEKERMEKEAQKLKEKAEKEAQKEAQKKEKELEKQKLLEEKERVRKEKQDEKDKQEKLEKAKQEKLAQSFKSFFKAPAKAKGESDGKQQSEDAEGSAAEGEAKERHASANQLFNQFRVKKDMRLAPLVRSEPLDDGRKSALDSSLENVGGSPLEQLYICLLKAGSHKASSSDRTWKLERGSEDDDVQILDDDDDEGGIQTVPGCSVEIDIADMMEDDQDKKKRTCQSRAKLLQFEENERPAYWGTWSKTSARVGPRRPFAKDCDHFDYDYDSDEDWEEEQDGEDLGEDDEKDAEEDKGLDDIEDDNEDGFFVGHGVLDKDEARHEDDSDEEGDFNEDEEMKRMKMKAAQFEEDYKNRKKKLPAKLKPRVYGLLWTQTETEELSEEERQKAEIVTRQLMSLLSPFRAIVHNNNGPITTSFTQSKEASPAGKDDTAAGEGTQQVTPKTPKSTKSSAEKKAAAQGNDTSTPTSAKSNRSGKSKTPGTPTSSKAKKMKAKKNVVDAIGEASGASTTATPTAPKVNPLGAWLALKSPKAPHATANSTPANETPTDSNENSSDIVVLNDAGEEKPANTETPPASQTPSGDQQAGVPTTEPVAGPAAPESKTTEAPKAAATPMDNSESSDKAGPPGQEAAPASV